MKLYGLIGYPLEHSFSPAYFSRKFQREQIDAQYRLFPLTSISQFPGLLESHPNLSGLNVTIPYKQKILSFISQLQGAAQTIRAVNTIAFPRADELNYTLGFNTDAYGFRQAIQSKIKPHHRKALILGTGGSSRTVAYVLDQLQIQWLWVSRKPSDSKHTISYCDLTAQLLKDFLVIVNTTPLGMYPRIQDKPDLPYDAIGEHHLLFDLIYNPSVTAFMEEGRNRGADTANGYRMLCLQAERSWELWNQYSR